MTTLRINTIALLLALATDWPGAWIGGASLSAGVLVEAAASRRMAARSIRDLVARADAGDPGPGLEFDAILRFYLPLALTTTIALLLALATGLSWWLGEDAVLSGHHLGTSAVLLVLALSAIKGALIALEFMELRTAPALWRRMVMGWMVVILGVIALVTTAP